MTIRYKLKNMEAIHSRAKFLLNVLRGPQQLAVYAARVEFRLDLLAKAVDEYLAAPQGDQRALIEKLKRELAKTGRDYN